MDPRIDTSKIPINGGAGAGIAVVTLLIAMLVELPELRGLAAVGMVSGVAFGLALSRWHAHLPSR